MTTFYNRDDDDREINHHGRTIEVGEAVAAEKVKMGSGSNLKFYQISDKKNMRNNSDCSLLFSYI